MLGLVGLGLVSSTDHVPPRLIADQRTMSHKMSKIRRLYDDPRLSMRWEIYSGCNLWYFKLERNNTQLTESSINR